MCLDDMVLINTCMRKIMLFTAQLLPRTVTYTNIYIHTSPIAMLMIFLLLMAADCMKTPKRFTELFFFFSMIVGFGFVGCFRVVFKTHGKK